MLRRVLVFLILALLAPSCAKPLHRGQAGSTQESQAPPHLDQALLFLSQLRPEDTNYQHSPSHVSFAHTIHENAECRTDCSGFVTAILKHTYRLSEREVRRRLGNERPLVHHYVAAIQAGPSFTPITKVREAKAGDIIAIAYPSDHRNSGHVMILAAPPRARESAPPLIKNTDQWEIEVIDATSSPHSDDSRRQPGEEPRTGAGRGTLRIYTDQEGACAGHTWTTSPKSGFFEQAERRIVIGRYKP